MEVDDPFAIFAYSLAGRGTLIAEVGDALARVVRGIDRRIHGAKAEGAITGLDGQASAVLG